MSSKFFIIIICLFSAMCASAAANNNQPDTSQSWIRRNFMILNSKFDSLNEEMEQWKANRSTGSDAVCVENPINSTLIVNTIQHIQTIIKKFDEKLLDNVEKFEEKLKTIENKLEKIEKFENKLERIEKFENKLEKIEKFENKLEKIEKFENKLEKFEIKLEKIEKLEAKLERIEKFENKLEKIEKFENKLQTNLKTIEDILWQLVNKSQEEEQNSTRGMTSQLKSQLDRVEYHLNQTKTSNVCEPEPCIDGGRCVPLPNGNDFRCTECPRFRIGMRCEKLAFNCSESRCWEHKNNTLYKLLEAKGSWAEAQRMCESDSMTLIMPKEKEQTEFIVNKLRAIYGTGGHIYFWLGYTNEGGSGWKWIDGSDVGEYSGGRSDLKSIRVLNYPDRRGILHIESGDVMWGYSGKSNAYQAVCEKRFSAH